MAFTSLWSSSVAEKLVLDLLKRAVREDWRHKAFLPAAPIRCSCRRAAEFSSSGAGTPRTLGHRQLAGLQKHRH